MESAIKHQPNQTHNHASNALDCANLVAKELAYPNQINITNIEKNTAQMKVEYTKAQNQPKRLNPPKKPWVEQNHTKQRYSTWLLELLPEPQFTVQGETCLISYESRQKTHFLSTSSLFCDNYGESNHQQKSEWNDQVENHQKQWRRKSPRNLNG